MSQFLIDTQIALWLGSNPKKISEIALAELTKADNILYLSYASIWEISIKLKTGKLAINMAIQDFISLLISKHSITLLPLSLDAIYKIKDLDFFHRDPFDRLIIAQAMIENIEIISSDKIFELYPVKILW